MKKILIAMVLFALMALPMSAMAMTSIDDSDLSTVTGQAGVSIGADLTMNLALGTVAWGDLDGINNGSPGTNGGWVGIQNLAINNLRIHMRTDTGMVDVGVAMTYGGPLLSTVWANSTAFLVDLYGSSTEAQQVVAQEAAFVSILATEQLMTIDIYTNASSKTFVRIGLPTFEITMDDLTLNVGTFTNSATNTPGTFQRFGQVYIAGIQMLLAKGNYVDIYQSDVYSTMRNPGNTLAAPVGTTSGVGIHVYAPTKLMDLNIATLSWGDLDGLSTGLAGTNGQGFVGIQNLNLAVAMDMTVNINVGTATGALLPGIWAAMQAQTTMAGYNALINSGLTAVAANNNFLKDAWYSILYERGTISKTSVDITLAGTVTVSTIAAQVLLAGDKALTSAPGILGNFYIGGMTMTIPNTSVSGLSGSQSWVSINAH